MIDCNGYVMKQLEPRSQWRARTIQNFLELRGTLTNDQSDDKLSNLDDAASLCHTLLPGSAIALSIPGMWKGEE